MNERILRKGLAVGIIVLFIGVGIQPAFADESIISPNITPRVADAKPLLINLIYAYRMGVILSRILGASKIHSLLERYQLSNQEMQKEITAVIERNDELSKKIEQLSDLPCECEKDTANGWNYTFLCSLLLPLFYLGFILWGYFDYDGLLLIMLDIGSRLNCFWPG